MLGWGWTFVTPVHAVESGFVLGLSLTHDSNISRVETNPQSDWTRALIAGLFGRVNTVDLTARIQAQVERRHFYRRAFAEDTIGFLDGAGVWTISPRQLTWTVEDTFRELQLNLTSPDIPSNLTRSNSLSTGPDLTLSMSATNSVVIGGRYGRFDIKNSNGDNRRYTGYLRGVHALSAQAKLSLNYEATSMYFEPGAQAYSKIFREDWIGRLENLSGANNTVLDLGTSRVTQYGGGSPGLQCQATATPSPQPCNAAASSLKGNRLARLTLSEKLSSQSTVRLLLSDQISDTYTDLLVGVTGSTVPRDPPVGLPTAATFATGDLYHSKRGELGYTNNDGRFGYTLQAYGRRVDFLSLDNDFQEKGGTFLWSWTISDALRLNASTIYAKRTYSFDDRQDTDRTNSVNGTYRLNGNVTVAMDVSRVERRSTVPLSSYVDDRIMLVLAYSSNFTDVRPRR
jgi:hypothetical protein